MVYTHTLCNGNLNQSFSQVPWSHPEEIKSCGVLGHCNYICISMQSNGFSLYLVPYRQIMIVKHICCWIEKCVRYIGEHYWQGFSTNLIYSLKKVAHGVHISACSLELIRQESALLFSYETVFFSRNKSAADAISPVEQSICR